MSRPDPFRSRNVYAKGYGASDDDYDPYNSDSYAPNPYGERSLASRRIDPPRPSQPQAPVNPASRRAERERRARVGGYGGFAFEPNEEEEDERPTKPRAPPSSVERQDARQWGEGSSTKRLAGRSQGEGGYARRFGNGNGARQMEDYFKLGNFIYHPFHRVMADSKARQDILQYVQRDWDFMASENCLPIQIALQLMDSSSLGLAHRMREFEATQQQLQSSLKAIVNEHHQGFNSSIGTFHNIQSSIQTSQVRIRALRDDLSSAKANLSTTKPELKGLAASSQNYDDMLQVLLNIEQLQGIPEQLEARISEKRFLSAVELLQEGLRQIRKSEMNNIGALNDLRVYLSNQETSLADILIEELHSHLYLKSPYCEIRWKQYAPSANAESGTSEQNASTALARGRKLYQYLDKLDMEVPMVDDTTRNPEADTFFYMQLLTESLNNLGRLEEAVETIENRLPVELHRVVEKCNSEVDSRHPSSLRGNPDKGKLDVPGPGNPRTAVLVDLLNTLYARFEAIAEGHRVIHEVIVGVLKREKFAGESNLTRGFREMWKLYQSEIRSVLHDYLATDAQAFRSGQDGQMRNVFRKAQRDKTKSMFKLSDMDGKSSDLATEKEDLDMILKTSVPGLVSESRQAESPTDTANLSNSLGGGTGHKLLIEANVFNMGTLLPPSLLFLNRLKEVVPSSSDISSGELTMFLDEFLVNVFLPQMDETLAELCAQIVTETDAFQQDPLWASFAQKPVFKGSKKFYDLIIAFCSMLDCLPHDQALTQLIVTQMVAYHDTCQRWVSDLVSRIQPKAGTGRTVKLSAALVKVPELRALTEELRKSNGQVRNELVDKETPHLLERMGDERLEEADLIVETKNVQALCLIYTSMKWLASKVNRLRRITDQTTDSSRRHSGRPRLSRSWTAVDAADLKDEQTSVYLPLSKDTAEAFDGAVAQYRFLADTALETLHLEIRCHAIYHLQRGVQETYMLEQMVNEPDMAMIDLNSDLAAFDEELSSVLPQKQETFITDGIGQLMDQVLVSMAGKIAAMNANGCCRIQLNILVLQQNLKNIEPRASLSRSALYYDLFSAGPDAVIAKAKEGGKACGFSYEEMKLLLELCYSEAIGRSEGSVQAKRSLDERLLELSEYLY